MSCANIVSPTGGPKDITPPVILKSNPANFSYSVNPKLIKIDFDEFIVLKDIASQVIISPFVKNSPEIKTKGKSIIIDIKDTLKPDFTYSITFGNSITDNNEGNILKNYRYVFSTGNAIDTLVVKGIIKNALSLKAEKNIYCFLYNNIYDSVPYKETPTYITQTNETGEFLFTNIKSGSYKIFALNDLNTNFLFDQPNEQIGFIDSLIIPEPIDTFKIDSLIKKNTIHSLLLFEEKPASQVLLKSFSEDYGRINLIFRKPTEHITYVSLDSNKTPSSIYLQEINETKDTLSIWLKSADIDTFSCKIMDNGEIIDTIEVDILKMGEKKNSGRGEDLSKVKINPIANNKTFDYYKLFSFSCSSPIKNYFFENIILIENKDTISAKYIFTDSIKKNISLTYKLKEKMNYTLYIPNKTFTDIYDRENDSLRISFTTNEMKDYGNLILNFKPSGVFANYIIQLISETSEEIIQKYSTETANTINFNNILPGNYKIKVICDLNKNNEWDTGNYLKKDQAEKIIYYPTTIVVKPNWDQNFDWDISE